MEKRTSALARIIAALALVGAVVAVVMIVSASESGDSSGNGRHRNSHPAQQNNQPPRTKAKAYVVKPGDTLISISHRTGVPVAEIRGLNPEVDPQILIAGETLTLR